MGISAWSSVLCCSDLMRTAAVSRRPDLAEEARGRGRRRAVRARGSRGDEDMGYKVAVVGATGAVGREMLTTLAERDFPADEVVALASGRSAGGQISFGEDRTLTVRDLAGYDFAGTDIALFSAGGDVSKEYAPKAGAAGCVVIDKDRKSVV